MAAFTNLSVQNKSLYQAIIENEHENVAKALCNGADVNVRYQMSKTPLILALENHCNLEIVTLLLHESNVNLVDENKKSPLMYALEHGNDLQLVRVLLAKGADVNAKDKNMKTPFMYAQVRTEWFDIVKHELYKAGGFINDNLEYLEICLLNAIKSNDIEAVKRYIADGVNLNAVNNLGRSPLIYALIHDISKAIPIYLIKYGAEVNIKDNEFLTPLLYAIKNRRDNEIIVELIYNGADISAHDRNNVTPLMYSMSSNKEIVKMLVNCGADLNKRDSFGKTALIYAIELNQDMDIIHDLIISGDCVNICDLSGGTPLMYALKSKKRCHFHSTAGLLSPAQSIRVVSSSISKRVVLDINDSTLSYRKVFIKSSVLKNRQEQIVSVKKRKYTKVWQKECVTALLQKGADVNMIDCMGNTVIHYDIDPEFINLIIKYGGSLSSKNRDEKDPLMTSVICNSYARVKVLLSLGANPNSRDRQLNTPLHFARTADIVNILVYYGGELNATNNLRQIPICKVLAFGDFRCFYEAKLAFLKNMLLFDEIALNKIDFSKLEHSLNSVLVELRLELNTMKDMCIKDDITFYEFCSLKKTKSKKYIDVSTSEYLLVNIQISETFPFFHEIIKLNADFNRIETLRQYFLKNIYKISVKPLSDNCQSGHEDLNYDCLYTIFCQFSYEQLYNVILASLN